MSGTASPGLRNDHFDEHSDLTPSEKSKRDSLEPTDDLGATVFTDSVAIQTKGPTFVSSITKNEPIVSRRELWAYYSEFHDIAIHRRMFF